MQADCLHKPTGDAGETLHRQVRAALLIRGLTLNAWCKQLGVSRQYAYQCLTGRRQGISAHRLLNQLKEVAQQQ